jgi:hypothetical protein
MLKRLVFAALLCAGAAHAQTTLVAQTFTVTFDPPLYYNTDPPNPSLRIEGESVFWDIGVTAFNMFPGGGGYVSAGVDVDFDFAPTAGFTITGYDLVYSLSFRGDTYTAPAGNVERAFGTFAGPGISLLFDETREDSFSAHVDTLDFFGPNAWVDGGYNFCPPNDPWCGGFLFAELTLVSVTITPNVVAAIAAVPEPETYALLAIGLLALMLHQLTFTSVQSTGRPRL